MSIDSKSLDRDNSLLDFKTEKVKDLSEWKHSPKPWQGVGFKKHTTSSETHYLYELAKELGGNVAEIGVMFGGNTVTMAYGLRDGPGKGKIYAVDYFGSIPKGPDSGSKETPENLLDYFTEHFPKIGLEICIGESAEVGRRLDAFLNLCFIDACHTYENCKNDFLAYSRLIVPNGVIAFHDTHFLGVNQVIQELGPEWQFMRQVFSIKTFRKLR